MLTIHAPAKINIVLEVLGKSNNRHRVMSVLQTINLCDVLKFRLAEGISFTCNEPSLQHDNIIEEAARLLKEDTHNIKGVQIELYKNIPWGSGLGGGSSDAASTLLALNKLWSLGLTTSRLTQLAATLGSDVAFFLYGGTALVEGEGEIVTPLVPLSPTYFILLMPPLLKIQHKTKQLYNNLHSSRFTNGEFVSKALLSLLHKKVIPPHLMFNAFEETAFSFFPRLTEYKQAFQKAGATSVHLAGSGPCLYTSTSDEQQACHLCSSINNAGLKSYIARSLPSTNSSYR
jgi:4-diphosphocytidyl-2-C-methyl-D-erythritol kinase